MSTRNLIRGCRRLTTTLLSKHSSPSIHRHPPSPPPSTTTHPLFNQTQIQIQNPFLPIAAKPQPQLLLPNTITAATTTLIRWFNSSTATNKSDSTTATANTTTNHHHQEMKHQEIEGPTVERDLSPLANETREVTNSLLKTMYNVSSLFALLGLSHLAMGAYYSYTITSASSHQPHHLYTSLIISVLAFGFPFSMAFMLRQSLKSMHFFQKMESIGRLQILTSTMQIAKNLRLFFVRVRALSFLCLFGLSSSFLYSLSSSL